jgi:adenylate cyclase
MRIRQWIDGMLDFAAIPGEPDTMRGRRRLFVGVMWVSIPLLSFWTVIKLASGQPLSAATVGFQALLHLGALVVLRSQPHLLRPIVVVVFSYEIFSEVATTYLFGGLFSSGVTIIWLMLTVVVTLIVLGSRAGVIWFTVFVAALAASAWMEMNVEPRYVSTTPEWDAVLNMALSMLIVAGIMGYFVRQRDRFQHESDTLLHSILPSSVADRLKRGEKVIADDVPEVSVLFADIVGFTPMSIEMGATALIGLLNEVFTTFDDLVARAGLEKIKTVGDEYMVAAGVPDHRDDHAVVLCGLALDMRDAVRGRMFGGRSIEVRIGISSGPVVAGVIGTSKFSYDLWGPTVNMASRMESTGVPGRIQVSAATCHRIGDRFRCEPRGTIAVKGLDELETWFLESRR